MAHSHGHVSGCYYLDQSHIRQYLLQVDLKSHTTIETTTSRTTLIQVFHNSSASIIKELRYTFPLYDGVSVAEFKCEYDGRSIFGIVKERDEARQHFDDAVKRNKAAGLLEQLPDAADVFTTTLGNVPADSKVTVQITYIGELKYDAEVDGLRFTVPTIVVPRYGDYPGELAATQLSSYGMQITIDISMPEGSPIKRIISPSHSIAVSLGALSTSVPDAEPSLSRGSATLALGTTILEKDFVLQVVAQNMEQPRAIVEKHPSLSSHAMMLTFVPKFSLKPISPEIVFIVDRSGSMEGNMPTLISALQVFLKTLPKGVKFNICSFGDGEEFLWPQSHTYNSRNLHKAMKYVAGFLADFGGTQTEDAMKATIENRLPDLPLECLLLTDGDIWNQQSLFSYLNTESEGPLPVRVFTLGIGNGVSSALIEGVARAGKGFSQMVAQGERLEGKVVNMLKAALSPHINDFTLELKYNGAVIANKEDDEFEIVEKPSTASSKQENIKPISLFDADRTIEGVDELHLKGKYDHLPEIARPIILQAPYKIPQLFNVSRVNIYVLVSEKETRGIPTSVVLKATALEGPLELETSVTLLDQPGRTLHQLAAKKAVQELEEGQGWVFEERESGVLLKVKHPSRIDEIAEREAVALAVQHQIASKWASFVAVEEGADAKNDAYDDPSDFLFRSTRGGSAFLDAFGDPSDVLLSSARGGSAFLDAGWGSDESEGDDMGFGLFDHDEIEVERRKYIKGAKGAMEVGEEEAYDATGSRSGPPPKTQKRIVSDEPSLASLIADQAFDGCWTSNDVKRNAMTRFMEQLEAMAKELGPELSISATRAANMLATMTVVVYMEERMGAEKDVWEMVVLKARGWLEEQATSQEVREAWFVKIKEMVMSEA